LNAAPLVGIAPMLNSGREVKAPRLIQVSIFVPPHEALMMPMGTPVSWCNLRAKK
jgi:hypothetical protein